MAYSINDLMAQLNRTISLIKNKYIDDSSPMLLMILNRYETALDIVKNKKIVDNRSLHLNGLVRSYLEAYNDYTNLLLVEMDKTEKMIKSMIK